MGLNDPLSEFDEPGKSEEARSEATPAVGKYAWVPDFIGKHLRGTSVRARMAKGVLWSVIAGVFTRGLFVVLSIVIARLLGEVEFGKWGMVQATVGVLANLAGMGVGQTLTKHLAELRNGDPVRAGRVFALAASQAILANFLVAIGCFCLADILAWRVLRSPGMASPLALSVLIAVTLGFAMVLECALAGFEAFRKIAHVKFAEMIATFIVMVALTKLFGLTGAIVGFSLGKIVSIVAYAWMLKGQMRRARIPIRLQGAWKEIGVLWHYSLPSLLAALAISPANWFSLALVGRQPGGFSDMSGWSASERWRGIVGFIPQHIRLVALPVLSQLKGAQDVRRYKKAFLANLAVTVVMSLLIAAPVALLSPWIMRLYGPSYVDKWDILVVLLGVATVQAALGVFAPLFVSSGKVWMFFWYNVLWAALLLGGSLRLVPLYGLRGFIWALLVAYIASLIAHGVGGWVLLNRQRVNPEASRESAQD